MRYERLLFRSALVAAMLLAGASAFAQAPMAPPHLQGPPLRGPPGAPGPRMLGRPPQPSVPAPPIAPDMNDTQVGAALDPWLADLAQKGTLNGVVVVARNGKEVFSRAYGPADTQSGASADIDTSFNIASIGKLLTRVAVAQLVQSGRVRLTDTLGQHVPDYPQAASRAATLEQLASHKGGIADFIGPSFMQSPKEQFASNRDYYRLVSGQAPLFAPGAREQYCNGCYIVLGELISRVTGESYEDFISRTVLQPARMSRSGFFRIDSLPPNTARVYGRPRPDSELMEVSDFLGRAGSAAGGVYASARDLLALDNAIRDLRLLDPAMAAWVLKAKSAFTPRQNARLCVLGGAPGTNASLCGDGAWTVVVLTNRDPPAAEIVGPLMLDALAGPASAK